MLWLKCYQTAKRCITWNKTIKNKLLYPQKAYCLHLPDNQRPSVHPGMRLTFAQVINPFGITVKKAKKTNANNGSCYAQLTGCVVPETSQAWLAIVRPVSKLPMKRIISGNDHWHRLPWPMATSQYLTRHHLHQSCSQRVMCGAPPVYHLFDTRFMHGM